MQQFLFFLAKATDKEFALFDKKEKDTVLTFLRQLRDENKDLVEYELCEDNLQEAILAWENVTKT